MSKCTAIHSYGKEHNRDPVPASFPTGIVYVLHKLTRGALAPPFLAQYLFIIASLHKLAGHANLTKDRLVQFSVFSFRARRRNWHDGRDGAWRGRRC